MELILIFILVTIAVFALYSLKKDSKKSAIQPQQDTAKQDEELQRLATLEEQYGQRGASLDKENLHVWIFDKSRKVVIFNYDFNKREVYSFDDIISCDLKSNDNVSEEIVPAQSETKYVTKTSGKSMAGRALVGAVIAGPVGAIIGGATAKKTTIGVTKTTPATTVKKVRTTWCAVIHVLKDGVEDKIPCYGYGSNKLKDMIDNIISTRNAQIETTE